MKRNRVLLILATIAVTALVAGFLLRGRRASAAGSLPELLLLAPGDSHFLAYVDIAALRDSALVQNLAAMAPPATTDRDYTDFVAATGFNYQKDLDRVVIASRQIGTADETVVFAEGRFNQQKIEQYALRAGRLQRENGQAVYVVPSATQGKTISLLLLSGDRIELADGGDPSTALAGSNTSFDAAMRERLSRVAGAPVFAVTKAPAAASGTAASGTAGGFSASFQSVRWLSFAARPDAGGLLLSIEGECDGPNQAQSVAAGLELLRGLLRNGLADPKSRGKLTPATAAAVSQALGAAQVSTDSSRVRLLMTVTPEMLAWAPSSSSSPSH